MNFYKIKKIFLRLERFEKTNEMLGNCCVLAEKRLEKAKKEFNLNKEQILLAKTDLDLIFRKILFLKKTLAKQYPKEYEAQSKYFYFYLKFKLSWPT